jgi:hypothetical protein
MVVKEKSFYAVSFLWQVCKTFPEFISLDFKFICSPLPPPSPHTFFSSFLLASQIISSSRAFLHTLSFRNFINLIHFYPVICSQTNYVLYSTMLHLPPFRFKCVGGCWDWTQLRLWHWPVGPLAARSQPLVDRGTASSNATHLHSVADHWHFGVDPDPDPRIHVSD